MRRHWTAILLFALALVMQTLAPAIGGASGGRERGVSSAKTEICLTVAGAGGERRTPVRTHHHCDQCPLCQSSGDGTAPLAASAALSPAAPVAPFTLAWRQGARAPPVFSFDHARQPRAPPAIS